MSDTNDDDFPVRHLTEDERQGAADGTLAPDNTERVRAHLALCAMCSADVARLEHVVRAARTAATPALPADDQWPAIRARLDGGVSRRPRARGLRTFGRQRLPWLVGGAIAAAAVLMLTLRINGTRAGSSGHDIVVQRDSVTLVPVSDSANEEYERDITRLLNELEMRRAMLRPETNAAVEHDLRVIDQSIAELKLALRRDPANAQLRSLLAASYRQKLDLLKRASDAS